MGPAKKYAESVPHTSLGLRHRRNPREAPSRNSTLKACHIANTKDGTIARQQKMPVVIGQPLTETVNSNK
jgi:hypothetical protein